MSHHYTWVYIFYLAVVLVSLNSPVSFSLLISPFKCNGFSIPKTTVDNWCASSSVSQFRNSCAIFTYSSRLLAPLLFCSLFFFVLYLVVSVCKAWSFRYILYYVIKIEITTFSFQIKSLRSHLKQKNTLYSDTCL